MFLILKQYKSLAVFLGVFTFILYANTLKNKYCLDDDYVTVTNLKVKGQDFIPNHKLVSQGIKGIPQIWKSNYAHDSESSFDYRPLTTTTFAIEYHFFGQSPMMSHLINLLLYIITVLSLFSSLVVLLKNQKQGVVLAFFASFIFLIHPIHTEVINNIKCRDELLSFLLPLIALWYSIKLMDNKKYIYFLYIFLLILFGQFAKLNAIVFVAIIPLCLYFFRELKLKYFVLFPILYVTSKETFSLFNDAVTEKTVRLFYHFENPLFNIPFNLYTIVIVGIKTLGFYLSLLVFPYPLRAYYGVATFDVTTDINLYFIIGILFIVSAALYIYKTKNKLFIFGLLVFLLFILPFLNIVTPVAGIVGERLIYTSTLGFSIMLVVLALPYLPNDTNFNLKVLYSKPISYIIPIVVFSVFYIWSRNNNWYNKITLFEHDVVYTENSAKMNSILANDYFEMLRSPNKKYSDQVLVQKCIKHYAAAVAADSSLYSAYNNAGVVYYSYLNDIPTAKKYFTLALRFKEKYAQAAENMGNCYMQENNFEKSNYFYKLSISYNPKQYSAYISYIKLLFAHNKHDESINTCLTANAIFPNDYELTAQTANSYLLKGDTLTSIKFYENAYSIAPNKNLAQFLTKKFTEIKDFNKAALYNNK